MALDTPLWHLLSFRSGLDAGEAAPTMPTVPEGLCCDEGGTRPAGSGSSAETKKEEKVTATSVPPGTGLAPPQAVDELETGLASLLGRPVGTGSGGRITLDCGAPSADPSGRFRVTGSSAEIRIVADEPVGCLYGSFALLRELSLGRAPNQIALDEAPAMDLRMLNHCNH